MAVCSRIHSTLQCEPNRIEIRLFTIHCQTNCTVPKVASHVIMSFTHSIDNTINDGGIANFRTLSQTKVQSSTHTTNTCAFNNDNINITTKQTSYNSTISSFDSTKVVSAAIRETMSSYTRAHKTTIEETAHKIEFVTSSTLVIRDVEFVVGTVYGLFLVKYCANSVSSARPDKFTSLASFHT